MPRVDDTANIEEHRANLAANFREVNSSGRPMFIIENGRTAAVVLSQATYDRLERDSELVRSRSQLDQSLLDIKAGRVQPALEALEQIAADLSVELEPRPHV